MKKICSKCGVEKAVSEFHKSKNGKYGVRGDCKECNRKRVKEYNHENKEVRNNNSKKWRENNKDRVEEYNKKYYKDNQNYFSQKSKEYRQNEEKKDIVKAISKRTYEKNKVKILEKQKEYYEKNKDEIKKRVVEYNKEYRRDKYANNPLYRLSCLIRANVARVATAVKQQKELRSLEYLGCSLDEFKKHIESLWLEGMTWDNHGHDGWHIDHIVPLDYFVKNEDDPWEANHYKNLQPLWAEDNFSKGNRID